ncbi:MAG TPA: carboxypeptidase regulatory-like domain-containing protein [Terriglobales bacterium]|nr:carboxypeptidase regulatory-like domain-containing protein [Terriglobales bacterium]
MKRRVLAVVAGVMALTLAASAGSISGKVSGVSGESVVYVDTIAGKTFPAPSAHPVMDQKGLLFSPHILAVEAGTTVDFLNSDKVAHNVFWPSLMQGGKKLPGKNLGTWPTGEKRPYKFDQPGVASLLCNVHPEMSGYIVVVPTPYHANTDKSGNFKIENVPDGQYNVVAWHEGAKNSSKAVTVAGDTKADLSVSK